MLKSFLSYTFHTEIGVSSTSRVGLKGHNIKVPVSSAPYIVGPGKYSHLTDKLVKF